MKDTSTSPHSSDSAICRSSTARPRSSSAERRAKRPRLAPQSTENSFARRLRGRAAAFRSLPERALNATARAVELTRDAEAAGADAILSVVPYYNKPTQAGLYVHFREIAECAGLPIILYDVPSRTACNLADETVARLAEFAARDRPQRRGRRCDTAGAPAPAGRRGFQAALRRRRARLPLCGAGRRRLHFGDIERCTRALPQHVFGMDAWAVGSRATAGAADRAIDRRAFSRERSRAGKVCAGIVRSHVAPRSFAAGRVERSNPSRTRPKFCCACAMNIRIV